MLRISRPTLFRTTSRLLSKSSQEVAPPASARDSLLWIAPHMWPAGRWDLKARVGLALGFVFGSKVCNAVVPFYFKAVVDAMAPAAASGVTLATAAVPSATSSGAACIAQNLATSIFGMSALSFVLAYGITRLTTSVTTEARWAIFSRVGAHAHVNINEKVFNQLHTLDLNFHLSRKTGAVTRVVDRGSRAFESLAWVMIFVLTPTLFEMGLVSFLLFQQVGGVYVAISVGAIVAYIGWTRVITDIRVRYRDAFNTRENKTSGVTVDSLLNYETVKYFGTESFEADRLRRANEDMNIYTVKLEQSMSLLNFGQQAVFIAAAATSLYLSAGAVLVGSCTLGDVVLIDALLLQLYAPLSMLGIWYRELTTSTKNMQAMVGLMNMPVQIRNDPSSKALLPLSTSGGSIEFKNVSFRYLDSKYVLQNISFFIPAGSTCGFVGPSGAGKSSIFRLIFRFFQPESGRILIDGQDISQVALESLREQIGVVPQDTVLFNESISYNIAYGKQNASRGEIERAARLAHIDDTISSFSKGYDTVVGERGLKLSGGEKQRLAIARVLLKGARIMLADEATSALDTSTEANVIQTLKGENEKRTVIMIAHRLTTIMKCDIIFVLDGKGGLAEQGSHEELLSRGGLYSRLWNEQLRRTEGR